MNKTAKEIALYFSTLPADAPIIIVWFEKEEAEMHLGRDLKDSEFRKIGDAYLDETADNELVYAMEKAGIK